MRKSRFPKAAYVRRLEQLYADLSEWRDVYDGQVASGEIALPTWRYTARYYELEQVQHDLSVAINHLYGLTDLS